MADLNGLKRGLVVNNADPERRGRLILQVPGLIDESAWALPMGLAGAGNGSNGTWNIPPIGAQVFVMFEDGDADSPVWVAGPFTKTEQSNIPADALAAVEEKPEDAHRMKVIETDFFTMTWDERTDPDAPFDPERSKQYFRFQHKLSGDFVEIDGIRRGLYLKATSAIVLECAGMIVLNGMVVQINDRIIQHGSHAI